MKKADAVQLIRDAEMRISHKAWDAMKDAKAMYGDCTSNYITAVTLINDDAAKKYRVLKTLEKLLSEKYTYKRFWYVDTTYDSELEWATRAYQGNPNIHLTACLDIHWLEINLKGIATICEYI